MPQRDHASRSIALANPCRAKPCQAVARRCPPSHSEAQRGRALLCRRVAEPCSTQPRRRRGKPRRASLCRRVARRRAALLRRCRTGRGTAPLCAAKLCHRDTLNHPALPLPSRCASKLRVAAAVPSPATQDAHEATAQPRCAQPSPGMSGLCTANAMRNLPLPPPRCAGPCRNPANRNRAVHCLRGSKPSVAPAPHCPTRARQAPQGQALPCRGKTPRCSAGPCRSSTSPLAAEHCRRLARPSLALPCLRRASRRRTHAGPCHAAAVHCLAGHSSAVARFWLRVSASSWVRSGSGLPSAGRGAPPAASVRQITSLPPRPRCRNRCSATRP